jgi:hypothetical protein
MRPAMAHSSLLSIEDEARLTLFVLFPFLSSSLFFFLSCSTELPEEILYYYLEILIQRSESIYWGKSHLCFSADPPENGVSGHCPSMPRTSREKLGSRPRSPSNNSGSFVGWCQKTRGHTGKQLKQKPER